jgi:hypothetical protein
MTSDDTLSLILRRLDEIERKLDRMLEELRTLRRQSMSGFRGKAAVPQKSRDGRV